MGSRRRQLASGAAGAAGGAPAWATAYVNTKKRAVGTTTRAPVPVTPRYCVHRRGGSTTTAAAAAGAAIAPIPAIGDVIK